MRAAARSGLFTDSPPPPFPLSGPAPENVTEKIYELTKTLSSYKSVPDLPEIDLKAIGTVTVGPLAVEVIDSTADYVALLKDIFDFEKIKTFLHGEGAPQVLFDALNGVRPLPLALARSFASARASCLTDAPAHPPSRSQVTGPYGREIFVTELGLPESSIQNCVPLPDFGGSHPDPNLTYAHDLVARVEKENIGFGAASDGDGDRNMIYGKGAFVTPSDSVAIIADWADAIPYFARTGGVKGLARSMPTSGAIDLVAKAKGLEVFEVPTGASPRPPLALARPAVPRRPWTDPSPSLALQAGSSSAT